MDNQEIGINNVLDSPEITPELGNESEENVLSLLLKNPSFASNIFSKLSPLLLLYYHSNTF